MANEVHEGDFGTVYELEIQEDGALLDISSYTTRQIIFKKPTSGDLVTNTAVFSSDGTDGKIRYTTTTALEIDEDGNWNMQGRLAKSGADFKTEIVVFEVVANLV